jgi:hypothetical protein
MTFGLKNVGATYQRVVNLIFHDLLGCLMDAYIDDLVIKSANIRTALERMRSYNFKTNPLKCAFRVLAGRFLGLGDRDRPKES